MPIKLPKRRPAFAPLNRLRSGAFAGGKKGLMLSLNLTAMVDMFTVIVIFLLQQFASSGELLFLQKNLKLPDAHEAEELTDRGPVVTLFENKVLWEGKPIANLEELDEADPGIPPLIEKLEAVREREQKIFGKKENEPFKSHVVIQADKATDFQLVRKSIYSVNQAGWVHINFAVVGIGTPAEGEEGAAATPSEG